MDISPIPRELIPHIWDKVEDEILRGRDHFSGKYTIFDVYNMVAQGSLQLWVVGDIELKGVILTEIVQYPAKKALNYFLVAGHDFKSWADKVNQIDQWAKAQGCESVEAVCRKGWKRILKYDREKILLERDL